MIAKLDAAKGELEAAQVLFEVAVQAPERFTSDDTQKLLRAVTDNREVLKDCLTKAQQVAAWRVPNPDKLDLSDDKLGQFLDDDDGQ